MEIIKLAEACNIYQPKTISQEEMKADGKYLVFGANGVIGKYDKYNHEESEVVITCRGATCGTVNYTFPKSWITGNAMVISPKNNDLNKKYLFYYLKHIDLSRAITGTAQPQITRANLKDIKIFIPDSLSQDKTILELDRINEAIENRIKTIADYNNLIEAKINNLLSTSNLTIVKLGEISERITKGTTPTTIGYSFFDKGINFIKIESITGDGKFLEKKFSYIDEECYNAMKRSQLKEKDILFSIAGAIGRSAIVTKNILPANTNQAVSIITLKNGYNHFYVKLMLQSNYCQKQLLSKKQGVAQINLSLKDISELKIPMADIEVEQKIHKEIKVINELKEKSLEDIKDLELLLEVKMHEYLN